MTFVPIMSKNSASGIRTFDVYLKIDTGPFHTKLNRKGPLHNFLYSVLNFNDSCLLVYNLITIMIPVNWARNSVMIYGCRVPLVFLASRRFPDFQQGISQAWRERFECRLQYFD
jgi:hypothetical protein